MPWYDPNPCLTVTEATWIKNALDAGISHRNREDMIKHIKDWDFFIHKLEENGIFLYESKTSFILSTSEITIDPSMDPEFE